MEKRAKAEYICYDNTLSLFIKLEKLIQISVLSKIFIFLNNSGI